MKNTCRITFAAVLSVAFLASPEISRSLTNQGCTNLYPREPLVLYEVSGGSLGGPIDYTLSVNNDGSARLASSIGDGMGSSQLVAVPPAEVAALHGDLVALGAFMLCDQEELVSDVPLSTLTIFRTTPRPRTNTFSWLGGAAEVGEIQMRLEDFIAEHFAPPPSGSGS
jgi:hypothetical protein